MRARLLLRVAALASWSFVLALLGLACGSAASKPADSPSGKGDATGAATGSSTPVAEAPAGPRKPSCTDGSCFECGEGICPTGFYCETAGSSAPACAWAAACAQKATCACLGPPTKGCTCEERSGVAHVRCSS